MGVEFPRSLLTPKLLTMALLFFKGKWNIHSIWAWRIWGKNKMNQVTNIQKMELSRKTVGMYTRLLYPTKNLKEKKDKHKVLVQIIMIHVNFSSKFP